MKVGVVVRILVDRCDGSCGGCDDMSGGDTRIMLVSVAVMVVTVVFVMTVEVVVVVVCVLC